MQKEVSVENKKTKQKKKTKKNRMANNVDSVEMACYEPSHLDLHCLGRYLSWSAMLKGLKCFFLQFLSCHYRSRSGLPVFRKNQTGEHRAPAKGTDWYSGYCCMAFKRTGYNL